MARPWHIKDLIDFEFLLYQDEEVSGEELARRDRTFFLGLEEVPSERSDLFHHWLSDRREKKEAENELAGPGEVFGECLTLLKKVVPFTGFVTGTGLATALLQYQGTQAVNVSTYFGVLIVLQIAMLLVLLTATIYRKKITGRGLQAAYPLLSRLFYEWASKASQSAFKNLDGSQRSNVSAGLGELKMKKAIYGRVMYHPVFQLVQSFGVLFNFGALLATLLRVLTRDIAFGWQSTVQVASGSVYTLAKILATPWRWIFGEGVGYPSLEQVEGSRMVLKEGLLHLSTNDLVSWWPFLCLCLLMYGLIPRWILWRYAQRRQAKSITELNFSHAACDRLYRRMNTPLLESAGSPNTPSTEHSKPATADQTSFPFLPKKGETTLLLIPAEIASEFDGEHLAAVVEQSVGRSISRTRPFTLGKRGLGELGIKPKESVTIFQEAWQPPIQEYLAFIRRLREHVAPETALVILLNGRTKPGEAFAAVKETDRNTWTQVMKSLADPYLAIAEVIPS